MRSILILSIILTTSACKLEIPDTDKTQFTSQPNVIPIQPGQIDRVSGLADSRNQSGNLWVIQESGGPAALTILGRDGQIKGNLSIPRFANRDWQDLAVGPGPNPGTTYLYIGEIGDFSRQNEFSQVYRLPEPSNTQATITQVERINFRYPDGPQDARAMFIDPLTKDIYIVTNRNPNVHLYRLAYPQNINEITTAESFGELPIASPVTGASSSSDGTEFLIRTYTQVYYWKRPTGQSVADLLKNTISRQMPLLSELKGEAIAMDEAGLGYFSLSQGGVTAPANLYYYSRQ